MSSVLLSLERLQADLAAIDPTREVGAADAVADLACLLRDAFRDALADPPAGVAARRAARG